MLEKKTAGFTLIEMMIVVVILGVLAAVAVPSLIAQIEKNQGQEAINQMTIMRSNIESCLLQNGNSFTNCLPPWDNINMSPPTGKFSYTWSGTTIDNYSIVATALNGKGTISINKSSGTMSCVPTGAYVGIC